MTRDAGFRTRLAAFIASTLATGKKAVVTYWKKTPTVLKALATLVIALNAGWQLYARFPATSSETGMKEKVSISLSKKSPTPSAKSPTPSAMEVASKEKMMHPLPDKPSIAVLPFFNMSGDKEQEYFSDGLTDTIITSLSRIPHLFVIASNSTFAYKGKPVKVQQVAEDLGVQYVLEGSVQKAEKKIRVRSQLIDALSGHHVWAESYDRDLKKMFALQDEITSKILTSLQVELTGGEYARAIGKGTKSLEALQLFWRAQYHLLLMKKEDNALSRQYAQQAIAIDSKFPAAWAELGFTHNLDALFGWSSSREESIKVAEGYAQKALSLNPTEPKALILLSQISLVKRDPDNGVKYAQAAIEANPNDPWAFFFLGNALRWLGRHEEAIDNAKKAIRLSPRYSAFPLMTLSFSFFHLRRYDDALSASEELLARCQAGEGPDSMAYPILVVNCSELGQKEKARKYAADFLKRNPNWNLEVFKKTLLYKNQSDVDQVINAARKAGLPG